MAEEHHLESVLVADCGSTSTRVSLIDLVGNEFRLVATGETATTVEVPWSRISIGVRAAIGQIEDLIGRVLLDRGQQVIVPERDDGSGVDGFIATSNAAVPLRLAVAGLIRSLSVESLLEAAGSSYVTVESVVAKDDLPAVAGRTSSMERMLKGLLRNRPDAILLGGGTDGGAVAPVVQMAADIGAALSAQRDRGKVHVLFAGNKEARPQVAQVLGGCSELMVVDNVRPTLETEDLAGAEEAIDRLYRELKLARAPGFGELKSWASAEVLPTGEGFGLVLRYLAQQYGLDVLGVDVGGSTANVAGVIGGRYDSTVNGELGVGYGISNVLEKAGVEKVLRWLPFEMGTEEVRNAVLNKSLRPMSIPETKKDLLLEQAVAREAISLTLEGARRGWLHGESEGGLLPPVDLIVGRGGAVSQAPRHAQAALVLLDALQPTGVCTLALDRASLLPQLGALALVQPLAAAQVVTRDGFVNLGTAICLAGTAREGSLALRVEIEYDDGQTIKAEVPYGAIEMIPLPAGRNAVVQLRPSSRFDVGLGKRGKGARTEVEGGVLGIILDARGRPLRLPDDEDKRRAKIQEWMWEMGLERTAR